MNDRPRKDWNQHAKHQSKKFYDNGAVVVDARNLLLKLSRFKIAEGQEKKGIALLHAAMLTAYNALAPVLEMLNGEHLYWQGKEESAERTKEQAEREKLVRAADEKFHQADTEITS